MKNTRIVSKKSILSAILLIFTAVLSAQSYNIDYYGIVSTEIDANMSKMTSDLYFTQLSEINNFSVSDKRTTPNLSERPDASEFAEGKLSFFTLITKDTIKQLIENDNAATGISTSIQESGTPKSAKIASTEELSGTWSGEDSINKIVIMRGGRGCVIFNNGASMNITVELSGSESNRTVTVIQKGNSNASFYPDLKRTAALSAAVSAAPIKWTLTLTDTNTLKGIKNTLLPDGDDYKEGTIPVVWTKLN